MELTYLDESQSLSEKKLYEMGVMDPVTNIYNIDDPVMRIRVAQGGIMLTGVVNILVGILIRYIGVFGNPEGLGPAKEG